MFKTIVICGSRKFKAEIREWALYLRSNGVIVFEPYLQGYSFDSLGSEEYAYFIANGLTRHHFDMIKKADVCFIFNKDNYIGNSVTLEMGCASAMNRIIIGLEPDTTEICTDVLFDFYINSKEDLLSFLKSEKVPGSAHVK